METLECATTTPPPLLETNTMPPISSNHVFGRGKRLTKHQRELAVKYLVSRDGSKCQICTVELADPLKADIDHMNPFLHPLHVASNLRLTCHSCNSSISSAQRYNTATASSALIEREIQGVGVGGGVSVEVRILELSRRYERNFRRFFFMRVLDAHVRGSVVSSNVLRVEAREWTGCSRASSYSYLERLLAENGPLTEDSDILSGELFLRFRNKDCYRVGVDDVERMYPLSGLLSKLEMK